jgi:hypothetical protein
VTLDAKAMEWAAEKGIDTKQLKDARIPIYGKWYHPDIPADVPLINLRTGEVQTFGPGLRAGEVLFVPEAELKRARLGPFAAQEAKPETSETEAEPAPAAAQLAVSETVTDQPVGPGEEIHMPGGSIFPLVLGFGLAIAMLGVVAGPVEARVIIALLGLVYLLTGGIGWTMEIYRETRSHQASGQAGEHGQAQAE